MFAKTATSCSAGVLAFASPAVRVGLPHTFAPSFVATPPRAARPSAPTAAPNRRVRMAATPPPETDGAGDDEQKSKEPAKAAEEEEGVSIWAITSFAIIFSIFMLGIAATIARDFVPGGMTGPAPM